MVPSPMIVDFCFSSNIELTFEELKLMNTKPVVIWVFKMIVFTMRRCIVDKSEGMETLPEKQPFQSVAAGGAYGKRAPDHHG